MNEVVQGDCREVLLTLPPESFDACLADPPYGDTSLDWDTVCAGWIPAVVRVLKPSASVWVFGSLRFLAPLFEEMKAHGFRYSQDIVWEKQNGTGFHADRFRRVHEHAAMFYRGAWGDVYHDTQYTFDAKKKKNVIRNKRRPAHFGAIDSVPYQSEDGGPRLQRSVIKVPNEHGRAVHPTQKPLDILRPLIRYSVPPGGRLVVPFAGVGSELLAAQMEGRDAFGVELLDHHVDIAYRRLGEHAFADIL